ncbi:MAG: CAAX amino terminal protease self- immunity [Elusimicrobia bacterium ADurb.Bin231]|nr:MAG: CAAX amino terminal protease self- immunity [Elusimicrobia bacterium ADurb.Bin231]
MMSKINRHFNGYWERGSWDFCWRIGMESLVVSLPVAVVLALIFGPGKRTSLDMSLSLAFFLMIIIAPPIETLIFQAFPIFIVRSLKGILRIQIIASAVLFSLAHFSEGITTGISAGLIGGLYFGFAYARWRAVSSWRAFWVTTVCHIIHNGIAFIFLAAAGALS